MSFRFNKVVEETQSREAAWFRENLYDEGKDLYDILWPRNISVKPALPDKPSMHFRTYDYMVMRTDFTSEENVVVACKAGKNDDPHHGHLDVGQFTVYWRGQGYICDIGTAYYDERYFTKDRWKNPHTSSIGHNVVFVNGELQIPAKEKNKPWKENVGGKVLEFRSGKGRDYTLIDATHAYPGEELKGWRRHITLDKPVVTVVVDEVKSKKGAEIEARFHSDVIQSIRDDYLLLEGEKGTMALIPVVDGDFTFRSGKHATLHLHKTNELKWVGPYCGAVLTAKKENTVIGTIILPVEDDNEAREIVKSVKRSFDSSGNLTISFTKDGNIYTYRYKKSSDGLVLE